MNDSKQQLSALIDGELDGAQSRFLLRRLESDAELAGQWSRWHHARALLRGETGPPLRADFAACIAAALADEAAPRRGIGGGALRWAGGLAVAASVAVAALLAVPPSRAPDPVSAPIAATSAAPAAIVAASPLTERDLRPGLDRVTQTVAASTDARALAPALRIDPQLESYLLRHNAALQWSGDAGFVSFVPVVAPVRPWTMVPAADGGDRPH